MMSEFLADLRASNAENARLAAELSCEQIGSASLADALEAAEMDCAQVRAALDIDRLRNPALREAKLQDDIHALVVERDRLAGELAQAEADRARMAEQALMREGQLRRAKANIEAALRFGYYEGDKYVSSMVVWYAGPGALSADETVACWRTLSAQNASKGANDA